MTTIYFVRHTQTSNPEGLEYGRMPGFHLNERGKEQAEKIAAFLAKQKVTNIFTSPLERGYETANIISEHIPNAKLTHSYELIEVNEDEWQGTKLEDLFKNSQYELFINDPDALLPGENLTQLAKRMTDFCAKLVKEHPSETMVCVSHEFPMLALKINLEGKPLKSLKTYNLPSGTVLTFTFDESGKFISCDTTNFDEKVSSLPSANSL